MMKLVFRWRSLKFEAIPDKVSIPFEGARGADTTLFNYTESKAQKAVEEADFTKNAVEQSIEAVKNIVEKNSIIQQMPPSFFNHSLL